MTKKGWRIAAIAALAFLTVLALGLDFTVALPNKLIVTLRDGGIGAIINNLLIALNHFHTMDHITGTLAVALCMVLYARYLLRQRAPWGEYALAAFLTLALLVCEAMTAETTVACLWAGGTQLMKTALFLSGVFPLCLCLIRALREGLTKVPLDEGRPSKHPFLWPFVLMLLCWIPYMIAKYPIGMSPDATVQILEYQANTISKDHPVLTTLAYGWLWQLGDALGDTNLGFFGLMIAQAVSMAAVLAHSLTCMRRWRVPCAVRTVILLAYCIVPNYSGWVTAMVKDIPYVIGCLLLTVLLFDFAFDKKAFFQKRSNRLLLAGALLTIWLWRRNGPVLAIAAGLYLVFATKCARRTLALVAACCAVAFGLQTGLEKATNALPAAQRETYSLMLQATGRIVKNHQDELPQEELQVISRILDYEKAAENYNPILTDEVKRYFIEEAGEENYDAYVRVALSQMARYPLDTLDSFLNLTYRIFDLRSDRTEYIKAREISHPYYIRSYTNLLYDQSKLQGLNASQEAVENWNFWFPDLPGVGMLVNIGFCVEMMLVMMYLLREKNRWMLSGFLPSVVTLGFLMLSSLVYIRYALPITMALPLWFAAYFARREEKEQ